MQSLHETIKAKAYELRIPFPEIPTYISDNLKYEFYDWQKDAFENLITFEAIKEKTNDTQPTHLMFNMATGTGKTLLMASCILYYYKQGYRKFIFFVNQNNIVDKTENNFINETHSKYLFADTIVVDDKTVRIEKVNTFSNDDEIIEIKFTTIQKLYNDIHVEKEDQVYLADLIKKDIVMLADEGHHLNADTKKKQAGLGLDTEITDKTSQDEIERKGWEHTVIELLLNKNGGADESRNVLLEFTATIPDNQMVADKYAPKTIYKFGLKEFLSAGYTKEINLISSTLDKRGRMLQALLFSWYRHQIALRNDIPNFKPVVLFRSKTIDDSRADYEEFLAMTKNLTVKDFGFLTNIESKFIEGENIYEQGKSRVLDLIKFIKDKDIKKSEIISFIKDNFTARSCIITNSKTNKSKQEKTDEDQEKLLNNLEDKDNHIRAIFTVNRLTEGWDVLNLFDIVRLYEGRDESAGKNINRKAGSATVSEIQLIGRGVRYYPFAYKDKRKNKRKFDNQLDNEMRVLEELYYHSGHNDLEKERKYIDELKRELKKGGFIDDEKIEKRFNLKKEFANSDFYKSVRIWKNEQAENPERKQKTLDYLRDNLDLKFDLESLGIQEEEINFEGEDADKERLSINERNKKTISVKIGDFEKHIFQKAVNIKAKSDKSLLRFELLKEELEIESLEDFREKIVGDFEIKLVTTRNSVGEVSNKEKLTVLVKFFDALLIELKQNINPHIGTEFSAYKLQEFFDEEVRKSVKKDDESQRIENELKYQDWYVLDHFYGTSEEKGLIEFIQETMVNLQGKYKEVYLLRNEEQYKIYDFNTGQGFQPDFILFLRDKSKLYYQIFIEPKGDNLLEIDSWKNDFLKEITEKYSANKILKIEGKSYNLIGLPLFNKTNTKEFTEAYDKLVIDL